MIIRPFRKGDEEGIRSLFKECFGREMSSDEWFWKYMNSYQGTFSAVAEHNGKIISHYGGLKMNFYYNGKFFNAYQGCDAMTHPAYRSRGIIVKTALCFYEAFSGSDFMFGFPSESHAIISAKYLGWEKHKFVCTMVKKANRDRYRLSRWRVETGWNKISAEEINSLWQESENSSYLSVIKKSDYIFWRYRDNPYKKYKLILFRSFFTGKLKAYAVVLEHAHELRVLELVYSKKLNIKMFITLLEQKAIEKDLKTVLIWSNKLLPAFLELKKCGYVEEKGIPYAIKHFKVPNVLPIPFLEYYNYTLGDYDAA